MVDFHWSGRLGECGKRFVSDERYRGGGLLFFWRCRGACSEIQIVSGSYDHSLYGCPRRGCISAVEEHGLTM